MGVRRTLPRLAEAKRTWNRARRRAFWSKLQASLEGKDTALLDFNEVSRRLSLRNTRYRGVQSIPLDQIVGSMGRYRDFTRTFLPIRTNLRERWQGVAALGLESGWQRLPPIEVYKAERWYFVKDGNHRCSVARQLGMTFIDANVWEFTDALPPHVPEDDIETLLLRAEAEEFRRQTGLDDLRPGHDVRLTQPGGYTDMLRQIARYQDVLTKIDETVVPYEEAVAAWYDMLYESSVQLIRDEGVLELFPDRTAADFFAWMMQNREALARRYRGRFQVHHALREFQSQHPRTLLARIRFVIRALLQFRS